MSLRLTNSNDMCIVAPESLRSRAPYAQLEADLQLFAEESGGFPDAGGTGDAGGFPVDAAQDSASSGDEEIGFPDLTQGSQGQKPQPAQPQAADPQQSAPAAEDLQAQWNEMRNGKFKEFFNRDTQSIVQNRLKDAKSAEESMGKLAPALSLLAKKFGVKEGDLDDLIQHITDDDSLYEDEALERGMDVATLKQIKQMEAQNEQLRAREEERSAREAAQAHVMDLVRQSHEVQQMYPGFDLQKEMQNPEFRRLTAPEMGLGVKMAYQLIHMDELQSQYVQAGAQQAEAKLASARQRNSARPTENGTRVAMAARSEPNPANLSLKELNKKYELARNEAVDIPFV